MYDLMGGKINSAQVPYKKQGGVNKKAWGNLGGSSAKGGDY